MHWYGDEMKAEAFLAHLGFGEKAQRVSIHTQDEMASVIEHLEHWMRLFGFLHKDIYAARLIVREAVSNALLHGNRNDPAKQVDVNYMVTPNGVVAEVLDQGTGFNPDAVPNQFAEENRGHPCAQGVFLMRMYSTWVYFNKTGNRVVLCRRRTESR